MKLKLTLFLTALFSVLIIACNNHKNDMKAAIKTALKNVNKSVDAGQPDNMAINKADSLMQAYVTKFPDDTLSPEFMYRTAQLYQIQRGYKDATEMLDKLVADYPNSKAAPYGLFLEGFIFENNEYDLAKAKNRYELFLQKYPNHELAKSVKSSLKNLGKSPEQILKDANQPDTAKVRS